MIDILELLICSQLIIISVFLLSPRKARETSHIILALFFIALAINLLNSYVYHAAFYNNELVNYLLIGAPFAFLYSPLIYFYVKSLTEKPFIYKSKYLLHLFPFWTFTAYLFTSFYFQEETVKRHFAYDFKEYTFWATSTIILNIQVVFYIVGVIILLKKYRKKIKTMFSSIERINYSWLKFLFSGLMLLWFADIARAVSITSKNLTFIAEIIFLLGFLLICYLILYKALTQPVIFSNVEEILPQKKKALSDEVNEQYRKKLLNYMENEKPYLDPTITIYQLAEKISIPPRSLSDVINNSLNKNFYDFINEYRINEAARLLSDVEYSSKTVLNILYEVGFNSKSSFNQAFKKHTGLTPTQFKKEKLFKN
jgi:AraC-like DNA-binding protein